MNIEQIKIGDKIKIKDVNKIKNGDSIWDNGDKVQVIDVNLEYKHIEVTTKNNFIESEYILEKEFTGIEKI